MYIDPRAYSEYKKDVTFCRGTYIFKIEYKYKEVKIPK